MQELLIKYIDDKLKDGLILSRILTYKKKPVNVRILDNEDLIIDNIEQIKTSNTSLNPESCKIKLVSFIAEYLLNYSNHLVIFQDSMVKKSDKCLQDYKSFKFFFSEETFFYINGNNLKSSNIYSTLLESTNAWNNIIIFLESNFNINDSDILNKHNIELLSKNAKFVAVDAFDLDGYLLAELRDK